VYFGVQHDPNHLVGNKGCSVNPLAILKEIRPLQPRSIVALLLIGLCTWSLSCYEELPPYKEPDSFLAATISAQYLLKVQEHSLRLFVEVRNLYHETLEGPIDITGAITVTFARDPAVKKTFPLSKQNLTRYNPSPSGDLRIDPNGTIILQAIWLFSGDSVIVDGGTDLSHGPEGRAPFLNFINDPTCSLRKLALPENLLLEATLTVFGQKGQVSTGTVVFPFSFVSKYVDPRVCPQITMIPSGDFGQRQRM
jgi:hypothetical protein